MLVEPLTLPCVPLVVPLTLPCWPLVVPLTLPCWPLVVPLTLPCWPLVLPLTLPCCVLASVLAVEPVVAMWPDAGRVRRRHARPLSELQKHLQHRPLGTPGMSGMWQAAGGARAVGRAFGPGRGRARRGHAVGEARRTGHTARLEPDDADGAAR